MLIHFCRTQKLLIITISMLCSRHCFVYSQSNSNSYIDSLVYTQDSVIVYLKNNSSSEFYVFDSYFNDSSAETPFYAMRYLHRYSRSQTMYFIDLSPLAKYVAFSLSDRVRFDKADLLTNPGGICYHYSTIYPNKSLKLSLSRKHLSLFFERVPPLFLKKELLCPFYWNDFDIKRTVRSKMSSVFILRIPIFSKKITTSLLNDCDALVNAYMPIDLYLTR